MSQMQRNTLTTSVTVGTAVADSTPIPYGNHAGGAVFVPAASSITNLTWYGSYDGVTYLQIYDGLGTAVTTVIAASQSCLIPAACYSFAHLKAVDAAGGSIFVTLKS